VAETAAPYLSVIGTAQMESHMTDTNTSGQLPEATPPKSGRKPRLWRGLLLGTMLLGVGAASGFAAGSVHGMPWWLLKAGAHHGLDPERIAKRIDHRVDRVLDRVDATEAQRDKVSGILKTTLTDLTGMGIRPWETHSRFIALMRADTIDPAAFEALRAEQISNADAASKRVVQALTEAAQVLTPAQRRELVERWDRHGPRGR
jgi:protein CpxP